MRVNSLALVFLLLLLIVFTDIFTDNLLSKSIHTLTYISASPIYVAKKNLEQIFEKEYTIVNVKLFDDIATTSEVLSVDSKGIYVKNIKKKGIAIDAINGNLVGFVRKTGNVGYISKWWEEEFPVTIESTDTSIKGQKISIVGYYNKYRIEVPDPTVVISGKVYMSEYMPYGRLLKDFGIAIGEYENGVFKITIPKIPKYIIILEEYEPNGGN
uniref:Cell shape-determining protein MreC n=1 Tax=Fervidobacterium nodosum TaxID=2424 RepID=A0A7C5U241_9BACT